MLTWQFLWLHAEGIPECLKPRTTYYKPENIFQWEHRRPYTIFSPHLKALLTAGHGYANRVSKSEDCIWTEWKIIPNKLMESYHIIICSEINIQALSLLTPRPVPPSCPRANLFIIFIWSPARGRNPDFPSRKWKVSSETLDAVTLWHLLVSS